MYAPGVRRWKLQTQRHQRVQENSPHGWRFSLDVEQPGRPFTTAARSQKRFFRSRACQTPGCYLSAITQAFSLPNELVQMQLKERVWIASLSFLSSGTARHSSAYFTEEVVGVYFPDEETAMKAISTTLRHFDAVSRLSGTSTTKLLPLLATTSGALGFSQYARGINTFVSSRNR